MCVSGSWCRRPATRHSSPPRPPRCSTVAWWLPVNASNSCSPSSSTRSRCWWTCGARRWVQLESSWSMRPLIAAPRWRGPSPSCVRSTSLPAGCAACTPRRSRRCWRCRPRPRHGLPCPWSTWSVGPIRMMSSPCRSAGRTSIGTVTSTMCPWRGTCRRRASWPPRRGHRR